MRLEATFLVWSLKGRAFAQEVADRGGCYVHMQRALGYSAPSYYEAHIINPGEWHEVGDILRSFDSLGLPNPQLEDASLRWRRS